MPLPVSEVERELTHTRRFRFEGYRRADGLWDIEAHITDHKNHDHALASGVRRAGQPIHDMWVRITIDADFNIRDALAVSDAVPYPGGCENHGDAYRQIIGLNLLKGFRKRVHERLGGVKGCTHITEMLGSLPTAAIQTFAGESRRSEDESVKPWHLDLCHAMDTSGETVRKYYPKWHAVEQTATGIGEKAA
ncbi:MAG: DUF2889 domain-containing protein [Burkholderiales bacterium]